MKKLFLIAVVCLLIGTIPGVFAQGGGRATITPENAAQLTQLIRLGRGSAEFVAVSADGSTILVGGTVGVWAYDASALNTETEPPVFVTSSEVRSMAYAADAGVVATAGDQIARWDLASGERSGIIDDSTGLIGISPDGSTVVYGGSSSSLVVFQNNAEAGTLEGHSSSINSLAFSGDGSVLVSGSSDSTVRVWDVGGLSESAVLEGHEGTVNDVAITADGATAASASDDRSIRLWDVTAGTETTVLAGPEDEQFDSVDAVALSSDGSLVASGHSGGNVRIFDVASGSQNALVEDAHDATVLDMAFTPDGSQLVTVGRDNVVKLWDVASGSMAAATVGHTDDMGGITFNPDSTILAIGNDDEVVFLWDTAAAAELNLEPNRRIPDSVSFSSTVESSLAWNSDGSQLAVLDGFSALLYNADGSLQFTMDGDGLAESVVFSPDDTLLAYASSDGAYVFDVATGQMLIALTDHNDWVQNIAFSPDQTMLATRANDHTVRVYTIPQ